MCVRDDSKAFGPERVFISCQTQRKAATVVEKQREEEMKVVKERPAALKLELQAEVEDEEVSIFILRLF